MRQVLSLLIPFALGGIGYAGGGAGIVATGAAGSFRVVMTEQGSVADGTRKLTVALYDQQGGKLLWKRQVEGRLYSSSGGTLNSPGWGVAGATLWVTCTTGGEHWTADNLGFRLSDGKPLWEHRGAYFPLAVTQNQILFRHVQSQLAYPDLRQEELIVNDLKTGATRQLNVQIPDRSSCGNINDYSFEDAAYPVDWADEKFFYARRKDACGVFITRFDWHESEGQTPTLTPQ